VQLDRRLRAAVESSLNGDRGLLGSAVFLKNFPANS
jgi:hypothetical protein